MNRAIIIWMISLLCCCRVMAQTYNVGDLYTASDGSKGIVYYLFPDGHGGLAVALNDASEDCVWGNSSDVPGLTNQTPYFTQNLLIDTAGYTNTLTLRTFYNNNDYAAGLVDFAHGWFLPSIAQLRMLYGQLPFISSSITSAGGTEMSLDWYWSSTEASSFEAWCIDFGANTSSGDFVRKEKTGMNKVRAVCYIDLSQVYYDTSLTYQWNTGSTQPYIDVNPSQTTTYQVTATTDFGCSNTAEQTVLVGSGSAQTIYDTICKGAGYEANGFSLSEDETQTAGTLTRTRMMTTDGCSSNFTLQLKVNEPAASTFSATAYGSYTWNGVTYYESGEYTQHFNCANGCDSVVTLHLTISGPPQVGIIATNDTICEGDDVMLRAVLHNAEVYLPIPPVAVGDILCTDNTIVKPYAWPVTGKTASGVVCYVDDTGEHGWAIHLHEQGVMPWSTAQSGSIPNAIIHDSPAEAISDYNGMYNTLAIRSVTNTSLYPAAMAVDYDNGWYLPASGQLYLMFPLMPILNESLAVCGGTLFDLYSSWYYCSSSVAVARNMWSLDYYGYITHYLPGLDYHVRSMCNF